MKATAQATRMASDMAEQPDVLRRLLAGRSDVHTALRTLAPNPLRGVALVARGSSENAALFARVILEASTGRPVTLIPPSMARLYGAMPDYRGWLVIALSQSGLTVDVRETLERARRCGAATIGITAHPNSPLTKASDLVLDLGTGLERAVPATKTFTAELAVLAMIAEGVGAPLLSSASWLRAIEAVADVLGDERSAPDAADRIADATHVSVIAAGLLVGVAAEAALKIQEAARLPSAGWSAVAFRHGPMSIAGPDHPVVGIAAGAALEREVRRTLDLLDDVPCLTIGDRADADLPIPVVLPATLAAIPAAVRAQQLALALALARGVDPDVPFRLKKVTLS
jgi:glutamine---fructose-6-phosphate transaminase (isomerizing)